MNGYLKPILFLNASERSFENWMMYSLDYWIDLLIFI